MTAPPSFDRVARLYHWAEYMALGPTLQRARTHFLPQLTSCRQALVLGDGDGRFLVRLLQQAPQVHALAVDTSGAMLHLLRQRVSKSSPGAEDRLHTLQASALAVSPPDSTDLIVTHFFLDCLTQSEVDQLVQTIADSTPRGTLWLLSDFEVPQHRLLRPLAMAYIRALYFAFRLLTGLRVKQLPDPQKALTACGFTRVSRRNFLYGLVYTELWRRE